METRVLIAIDLSDNSLKAVDYVSKIFSCHEGGVHVTLLHVIKEPSHDIMPDSGRRELEIQRAREGAMTLMEQAGQKLTAQRIPEKNVHLKIQVCRKHVSVAELILSEQQKEGYGTIVVGRRGVSKREEFLFGSVSNSVVREAKDCAVWVVE